MGRNDTDMWLSYQTSSHCQKATFGYDRKFYQANYQWQSIDNPPWMSREPTVGTVED